MECPSPLIHLRQQVTMQMRDKPTFEISGVSNDINCTSKIQNYKREGKKISGKVSNLETLQTADRFVNKSGISFS